MVDVRRGGWRRGPDSADGSSRPRSTPLVGSAWWRLCPLSPNGSRVRATRHSAGKGDVPVVALGQRDGVRRRDRRGRGRTEPHTGLLGLDADGAAGLTGCPVRTGGVLRKEGGPGGPEHEATVRGGPVSVPAYGKSSSSPPYSRPCHNRVGSQAASR